MLTWPPLSSENDRFMATSKSLILASCWPPGADGGKPGVTNPPTKVSRVPRQPGGTCRSPHGHAGHLALPYLLSQAPALKGCKVWPLGLASPTSCEEGTGGSLCSRCSSSFPGANRFALLKSTPATESPLPLPILRQQEESALHEELAIWLEFSQHAPGPVT